MAARDARNNAQRERLLISRATLGRTLALAGRLASLAGLATTAATTDLYTASNATQLSFGQ